MSEIVGLLLASERNVYDVLILIHWLKTFSSDYPFFPRNGKYGCGEEIEPERQREMGVERASGYNYFVQSESDERLHRKSFEANQNSVFDKSKPDAKWNATSRNTNKYQNALR